MKARDSSPTRLFKYLIMIHARATGSLHVGHKCLYLFRKNVQR